PAPSLRGSQALHLSDHPTQYLRQSLARRIVPRPPRRPVHRLHHPAHGAVQLRHRATERAIDRVLHPLEDLVDDVLVLLDELPARCGDLVYLLPLSVLRNRQALVLEPLQRGVYSAGRGGVTAVQLLLELLHHFVAVARLVAQELQNDVLHVPRLEPLTAPAPRACTPEPRPWPEPERIPCEMPGHVSSPFFEMLREDIMARYIVSIPLDPAFASHRCRGPSCLDASTCARRWVR